MLAAKPRGSDFATAACPGKRTRRGRSRAALVEGRASRHPRYLQVAASALAEGDSRARGGSRARLVAAHSSTRRRRPGGKGLKAAELAAAPSTSTRRRRLTRTRRGSPQWDELRAPHARRVAHPPRSHARLVRGTRLAAHASPAGHTRLVLYRKARLSRAACPARERRD
jgi:hypothetical protein